MRGYSRRRAERVYGLTVDYFARNPDRVIHFTSVWSFESEPILAAERERVTDAIVATYIPGFWESLAWIAAKYFVRWRVRRLVHEWLEDPTEFRQVVEDLE